MRCWSMDAGLVGGRSIYDSREREMIFCFEICDIYSVKGDKASLKNLYMLSLFVPLDSLGEPLNVGERCPLKRPRISL